jgi:hypothetical protein
LIRREHKLYSRPRQGHDRESGEFLCLALIYLTGSAIEAEQRQAMHIELVARAGTQARSFYQHAGFFEVEEAVTYVAGRAEIAALMNRQA